MSDPASAAVQPPSASGPRIYGAGNEDVLSDLAPVLAGVLGSKRNASTADHAGHAGGNIIEEIVRTEMSALYGERVQRQHTVLNSVLTAHLEAVTKADRVALFGNSAAQVMLCEKRDIANWTADEPFRSAQGDTADAILFAEAPAVLGDNRYALIDAKSVDLDKHGQAPNIISATKVFNMALAAVSTGCVPFDLVYLAAGYRVNADGILVVERARAVSLFKIESGLYINWAAANQIQFHPLDADQSFTGTPLQWADRFLDQYRAAEQHHIEAKIKKQGRNTDAVAEARAAAASTGADE